MKPNRIRCFILGIVVMSICSCISLREEPAGKAAGKKVAHLDEGWMLPDAPGFHGSAVRAAGWEMDECKRCHGADFKGDAGEASCRVCHSLTDVEASKMPHKAPSSCLKCHTEPPDSCNGCHGTGRLGVPPPDLDGYWGRGRIGVGAHEAHLAGRFAEAPRCRDCHAGPQAGHYDTGLPAEVAFSEKAAAAGRLIPQWDRGWATCSSIYCHGDTIDEGEGGALDNWDWTDPSVKAECGSCHGLPPAKNHSASMNDCASCHTKTVDAKRNILDKSLHVNGKIDLFLEE